LQSVVRTLVAEFAVGQAAQFFINSRQQGIEGGAVAALPALQKLRNLMCRVLPHEEASKGEEVASKPSDGRFKCQPSKVPPSKVSASRRIFFKPMIRFAPQLRC
jgi:hypothetical protein